MVNVMRAAYFLACICGIAFAAPATAQSEGAAKQSIWRKAKPAIIKGKSDFSEEEYTLRITDAYASCLLHSKNSDIRNILTRDKHFFTEKREARILTYSGCLRNGLLTMSDIMLRGALFRQMYLDDFPDNTIQSYADPINYFADSAPDASREERIALTFLSFASCVVRTDQDNVRTLVTALPGDDDYNQALQALIPHFNSCMPQGITVKFNKTMLTSYFSEALYWETLAAEENKPPIE